MSQHKTLGNYISHSYYLQGIKYMQAVSEDVIKLETASGYSIDDLTKMFLSGYELQPPNYKKMEDAFLELKLTFWKEKPFCYIMRFAEFICESLNKILTK